MFYGKKQKRMFYISITVSEILEKQDLQGADVFEVGFLIDEKNYEKKGMVQKLVDEHDRRVGKKIPENTPENRRSHTHWFRWFCIGACIIGFVIAVCVAIYYMINPIDLVRGFVI